MQYFSIKDIENLCGIKAHTLRIWEHRYQIFVPKRKGSTHRVYDNEDLKQLLRISFLYHSGWKISKIATLNEAEILNEVRKAEVTESNYKIYLTHLIEAAIDFNEAFFARLLEEVTQKIGFEKCITEVCYPFLQKVGMLWVTNRVIPAQEHFSSYLIQNKIIAATEKYASIKELPSVILFSAQGEFHELPLLFINYLLRKNGWGVIYLGSNVKKSVLSTFANKSEIKYLFLHLITNFTGMDADDYFEDLCRAFYPKTIVASGSIIHQVQRSFTNLKLLRSDEEIIAFIEQQQ